MKITIAKRDIDAIDAHVLAAHGHDATDGMSLEIKFEGSPNSVDVGRMLGGAAGAWLAGVKKDGRPANAAELNELANCIIVAFGVSMGTGIRMSAGDSNAN